MSLLAICGEGEEEEKLSGKLRGIEMEKRGEIKSDGKRGGEAKREGIEKAKKINKERER